MDFHTEYLCEPYSIFPQHIRDAAEEYDRTCEAFDRLVCSCRRDGEAIPMNSREFSEINRHAKKVRDEILRKYGISWKELRAGLDLIK